MSQRRAALKSVPANTLTDTKTQHHSNSSIILTRSNRHKVKADSFSQTKSSLAATTEVFQGELNVDKRTNDNNKTLADARLESEISSFNQSTTYKLGWPGLFGGSISIGAGTLMKTINGYLRTFMVFASKVWTFMCFVFRKQTRAIIQHKTIRYPAANMPVSQISLHRLKLVRRKVLVLDLDETLIHSHHDGVLRQTVKPGTPPDFILKVTIDRHPVRFFVHKRPHVDFFLDIVSKWYELVVFTASMEIYGTAVADKLDTKEGILRRRYYRQHCTLEFGSYTKDLSAICSDLQSVFILDNSPGAYRAYPDNAIPIKSWFNDPSDTALLNLLPVLDALRFVSDVRSVLSRNREAHRNWNR